MIEFFIVFGVFCTCTAISTWLYYNIVSKETRLKKDDFEREHSLAFRLLTKHRIKPMDLTSVQMHSLARDLLAAQKSRLRWTTATITVLVTLIAAISLTHLGNLRKQVDVPRSVYVADSAGNSLQIALTARGLTLQDAIVRANVANPLLENRKDNTDESWLVAYQHGGPAETDVFYFPLPLVQGGLPGYLALEADDHLRLVKLEDTSLGVLESTEPGITFQVTGKTSSPGKFSTSEVSEVFMNVHTEEYAGSFETDENGPDVMIVKRDLTDIGPTEHFFIPLKSPFLDRRLLSSRIRQDDQIEYGRLDQIPMFVTSFALETRENDQR